MHKRYTRTGSFSCVLLSPSRIGATVRLSEKACGVVSNFACGISCPQSKRNRATCIAIDQPDWRQGSRSQVHRDTIRGSIEACEYLIVCICPARHGVWPQPEIPNVIRLMQCEGPRTPGWSVEVAPENHGSLCHCMSTRVINCTNSG